MAIHRAGIDDTYYQNFSTIEAENEYELHICNLFNSQDAKKELILYQDYNLLTSMNAGGIDFFGELTFC